MKRSRRATSVLLLVLMPALAAWPGPVRAALEVASQVDAEKGAGPTVPEDLEAFRAVMLDFVRDMDQALQRAIVHPALAQRAASIAPDQLVQVPLGPEVYEAFKNATGEELIQLRDAVSQFPDVLEIPQVLDAALTQLPVAEPGREAAAACSDNYAEFGKVVSVSRANRGVTRAIDTLAIVYVILDTITEVFGAATEDAPYTAKIPSIPLIFIRGILGFVKGNLEFAKDLLSSEEDFARLCLATCLTDEGDIHGQPTARWRGRGCDNRDNNCAGGIDDRAEDRFAPEVALDAAIVGQCFRDPDVALDAVELAVKALDDCSEPSVKASLGQWSSTSCEAPFTVMVTDAAGNRTDLAAAYQKVLIDLTPPTITTPPLEACYPSVAAARAAFTGPGLSVTDCTAVDLSLEAVEKECVVDFELTATDRCGRQDQQRDRARIDAAAPDVNIERLLIPTFEGLACFAGEEEAVAAVAEATVVGDRCTAPQDLVREMTTSGDACNLNVTASATDQCGNSASDSLLVRVDTTPPKVSCSVQTNVLYPADDGLVDVGFVYDAFDPCDPDGVEMNVEVTSDESTSLAYSVIAGADPYPDAFLTYGADGRVEAISLRAQRSQANTADGRVYRIRVTATNSCGLQNHADCFVSVPRSQPGPGSAINSGQGFDATKEN